MVRRKPYSGLVIVQGSYDLWNASDRPAEDMLSWTPTVDLFETDDHYVMNAELPGVEGPDVRVEVRGTELIISGERRQDSCCTEESYQRLEGMRGRFRRVFTLPEILDDAEIKATLNNGILQVVLTKSAQARKIEVTGRPR